MFQKIINFTPLEKTGESKKTKTSLEGQKIASKSGFLDSLTGFIKYHNAVSIGISLVLALSFSAMASDDIKDAVLGEKIVTEQGIDNSALLAADLANFDLAMKIIAVSQDETSYYIDYAFKTLGIEDNRWREIAREKILTVSKAALGSEDLGIYATEEISEVADNELAYLKEVQTAERAKGETKVVQTTDYSGLIGLVLDVKNRVLPGYEPVIKPPEVVAQPVPSEAEPPIITPISEPEITPEPEPIPAVAPEETPTPTPAPEPTPEPTPTPDSTHSIDSGQASSPQTTPAPTPEPTPASAAAPTPIETPEPAATP